MKNLTILFIACFLVSCGGLYTYEAPVNTTVSVEPVEKVLELEGDKNELYVRANKWMVQNFNNAKSVVQFSDKESGVVTGKYLLGSVEKFMNSTAAYSYSNNQGVKEDVYAIIGIDVKDGAAKITLTPQSFIISESKYWTNIGLTEEGVKNRLQNLTASFEDYMQNEVETF